MAMMSKLQGAQARLQALKDLEAKAPAKDNAGLSAMVRAQAAVVAARERLERSEVARRPKAGATFGLWPRPRANFK